MKTDADTNPLEIDIDPEETREWKEALEEVIERDGPQRAHFLIESLVDKARRSGAYLPYQRDHGLSQYDPGASGGQEAW